LPLPEETRLVFFDVLMPGGMNGLEFVRAIRDRFPGIPALPTTGYSASAQDAVRAGELTLVNLA
jgi:CheY-like chemotaxis protein